MKYPVLIMSLLLLAGCSKGVDAQAICATSIVFTANSQPAMHNVMSTISRHGEVVHRDSRHRLMLDLPCGAGYQIVGVGFKRDFDAGAAVVIDLSNNNQMGAL